MSRPLEKTFQGKVRRALKALPNTWFFKASERSLAGIPDMVLCVNGRFIALELKRDVKSKATRLQSYTLDQITQSGGLGFVVSPENWNDVFGIIRTQAEGIK